MVVNHNSIVELIFLYELLEIVVLKHVILCYITNY